jgi:hypothetical protein
MPIVYTQKHRFFNDLITLFSSISSLGTAFEANRTGTAKAYSPQEYITLEGITKVSNIELRFFPYPLMEILIANKWPTRIEFETRPISNPTPSHPLWLTGLQGIHGSMIQSAFVHYFESIRPVIENKFSKDTRNWPNVCNFARVIRNAFAHGGMINFENPNAIPVQWKTLSYSPSENGRQILYQDVTAVEIILLMEEVDSTI